MKKYAIGVDIGGSHISCAAIDIINGTVIKGSETDRDVDNKASSDIILNEWSLAIKESLKSIDTEYLNGIGFAMPGPFLYDKGIAKFDASVAKFEKLYDVNINERLSDLLKLENGISFRFMNDASAFAVGEAWLGKGSECHKSVSITLGTGFGSAFITNGVPVVEGEGVPKSGCVWHLPFEKSIGDDYFSTRWFEREWEKKSGDSVKGVKTLADLVKNNDEAKELFITFGDNLGKFLGPWLKSFEAEVLIIGGNISGAFHLFGEALINRLNDFGLSLPIEISNLKEDAAKIGAARMLDDVFYEKIVPVLPKM